MFQTFILMPELCTTNIRKIERLLRQCSDKIEKYAPVTSPDQDLCRRCRKMIKKLQREYMSDSLINETSKLK